MPPRKTALEIKNDWVATTLVNDETATDVEMITHFVKEGPMSEVEAAFYVSQRQAALMDSFTAFKLKLYTDQDPVHAEILGAEVKATAGVSLDGNDSAEVKTSSASLLKSLIGELEAMQTGMPSDFEPADDNDRAGWFGGFNNSHQEIDGTEVKAFVQWPNIAILLNEAKQALAPATIPTAGQGAYSCIFRSVGNPDTREYYGEGVLSPTILVRAESMAALSKHACDYIDRHNLGGGNWPHCWIMDKAGKQLASISYNGRLWDREHRPMQSAEAPPAMPELPKPKTNDGKPRKK